MTYQASNGTTETFVFVGGAPQCTKAADRGYYFDNPDAPTKVVLCPNACERLKSDTLGQVNLVFGCARVDVK